MTNTSEATAIAAEHTLTQSELDRARLYLEQTKNGMVGAIKSLSEPQWRFKPSLDRWSIVEILDHVIVVQERVLGPVREKLETALAGSIHPDYAHIDDIIIFQFPNRLTKFPTPLQPVGDLARCEAIERLSRNYSRLNEFLEAPGLRYRSVESAPLKAVSNGAYDTMDGYQWILAAAAHTERHTKQVLEIMSDPEFPS